MAKKTLSSKKYTKHIKKYKKSKPINTITHKMYTYDKTSQNI